MTITAQRPARPNAMVVRLPLVVLAPLRLYFQLAGRIAPAAAAGAFRWLLSHMPRRALSTREQAFLDDAQRTDFDCGDAVLAGYSMGAGPTVLLVHGLQGSAANFRALMPALARAGYRAVAFDAINHGNSPPGTAFSQRSIEHVRQVMAQLGPLHAVVCHSAGAYLAMLALCAPTASVKKCVYMAPYPDIATTLRTFARYLWVPRAVEPRLQRWFEDIGGLPFAQQSMRHCLPRHGATRNPACLFVHDADDRHIPLDSTQATLHDLQQMPHLPHLPDARLHVTSGLGHFHIVKDPGVIAHIVEFLQQP